MINFVIWSPEFNDSSGGIIALHKLADLIGKFGEKSYIVTSSTIENSCATTISSNNISDFDRETTMVIYPEIVIGNPYGFKYVTRWLLNSATRLGDGIFGDDDLIYKYYNYFTTTDESKVKGELRTFDLKLDKFYNRNQFRDGECYIVKKGANKLLDKHSNYSVNIDQYPGDDFLVDLFNKSEKFISYDSMCFHLQQAALCGCLPIVIPDEGITKEEFFRLAPVNKFGVAYGFEDVEHAKATLPLVKDYLLHMESESFQQVKKFIRDCYEHMAK